MQHVPCPALLAALNAEAGHRLQPKCRQKALNRSPESSLWLLRCPDGPLRFDDPMISNSRPSFFDRAAASGMHCGPVLQHGCPFQASGLKIRSSHAFAKPPTFHGRSGETRETAANARLTAMARVCSVSRARRLKSLELYSRWRLASDQEA